MELFVKNDLEQLIYLPIICIVWSWHLNNILKQNDTKLWTMHNHNALQYRQGILIFLSSKIYPESMFCWTYNILYMFLF